MDYKPIIIIGAPRSGTNILRDSIAQIEGVGTFDCDELPYLWRYGQRSFPSDEFIPDMVNYRSKEYIRKVFSRYAAKKGYRFLLEKTCANSLRVDYVSAIFPEAFFVYIVRDGYDVVSSIYERLSSNVSLKYSLKKLKFIPVTELPYYFFEYFSNRFNKMFNKGFLKQWGPRFTFTEKDNKHFHPRELAAMQWFSCVSKSDTAFNKMDNKKYIKIKYEDFVSNPEHILNTIAQKYGLGTLDNIDIPKISISSIGKGRNILSPIQKKLIQPIVSELNLLHGYDS
jgi:hypothetical protein